MFLIMMFLLSYITAFIFKLSIRYLTHHKNYMYTAFIFTLHMISFK